MAYAKLISETKIEIAPQNKDGIINYNLDIDLMKADGYKLLVEAEKPTTQRQYILTYTETPKKITETVTYTETQEEYEKRIELAQLKQILTMLDQKRIRAVCEPSIKEGTQTWLDYYNEQVQDIRRRIQQLEES